MKESEMLKSKEEKMYYQQGDVILERVNKIDPKAKRRKPSTQTAGRPADGLHILAHGEATGHKHAISASRCEMYEREGVLYLKVLKPSELKHEEHKTITIPTGRYRVRRVQEYDHFAKEARSVQD